jgi:preprotein translocase subunit SecB
MDPTPPEHPLLIMAQYIRDFSFENPNAPEVYPALSDKPPEITVNIDLIPAQLNNRTYEIVLAFRAKAMSGEQVAFLIELDYAAIVSISESVAEADLEPLLFIETPRHLFPFARNILANVTRDAAFPPLVVNPIDFESYYQRTKKGTLKAALAAHQEAAQTSGEVVAASAETVGAAPEAG